MTAADQTATHMAIANTLLAQLGGGRFIAMTGARESLALSADQHTMGGLQFSLPPSLAKDRINKVRIFLELSDTYKVEALAVNYRVHDFDVKGSCEGVFDDMLEAVFSDLTGLATRI